MGSNQQRTADGGQAFPQLKSLANKTPASAEAQNEGGMSLRDWFATHAPIEIPQWFAGRKIVEPIAPTIPASIENEAKAWLRDPCYDLEGMFDDVARQTTARAFQEAHVSHDEERYRVRKDQEILRYIEWRWHYADLMLASRGEA